MPVPIFNIGCFRKWPLGGGIINHGRKELVGIRHKENTFVGIQLSINRVLILDGEFDDHKFK